MMRRFTFALVLALGIAPRPGLAQAEMSADQIIERMLERDLFGWQGAEIRLRMLLRNRRGETRERVMESISRRDAEAVRMVMRFRAPAEVAGTSFLLVQPRNRSVASEQYIYLPALRRSRRIIGGERRGSFMGSDFSYADMEQRGYRQGQTRRLADESLSGRSCYVLELTPERSESEYGRLKLWVLKDSLLALKIEFVDRRGTLVKTLVVRRVRNVDGRAVAVEAVMTNHAQGSSTEIFIDHVRFREDLPAESFTMQALERG